MCRPATPDRVAAVDGDRRLPRTPRLAEAGLFLVESTAPRTTDGAAQVAHALRYTVGRLAAAGTAIRWCSGLYVPAGHRLLCLVAAGDRADVVLARDTAALSAAAVHRVYPLPDRPSSLHPSRREGRS
jgi:hypothetical protein